MPYCWPLLRRKMNIFFSILRIFPSSPSPNSFENVFIFPLFGCDGPGSFRYQIHQNNLKATLRHQSDHNGTSTQSGPIISQMTIDTRVVAAIQMKDSVSCDRVSEWVAHLHCYCTDKVTTVHSTRAHLLHCYNQHCTTQTRLLHRDTVW